MSSSLTEPPTAPHHLLTVEGSSPAAVISVIDGDWRTCRKAIGRLREELPEGIYKVVVEVGRAKWSKLVALQGPTLVEVPALERKTVVPMRQIGGVDTTRSHEYHADLLDAARRKVHVEAGTGSRVLLLSRTWTSREGDPTAAVPRVRLQRWRGDVVADLAEQGQRSVGGDGAVACTIAVNPGTYVVAVDTGRGTMRHVVEALPGWESQAFVLADRAAERAEAPAAAVVSTVLAMTRFALTEDHARAYDLIEVAGAALADQRVALSTETLFEIAMGKFSDPLLGLMAAHIMLLARDQPNRRPGAFRLAAFEAGNFEAIVRNTAEFFGEDQADIVALRTQIPRWAPTSTQVTRPPILRRSWGLLVAASNGTPDGPRLPDLVGRHLWRRIRGMTSAEPYLTWVRADRAAAARMKAADDELRRRLRSPAPMAAALPFDSAPLAAAVASELPEATLPPKPKPSELAAWAPGPAPLGLPIEIGADPVRSASELGTLLGLPNAVARDLLGVEAEVESQQPLLD